MKKFNAKSEQSIQLVTEFNEVIKLRESWEVGAYKASNDELYDILAAAYKLYLHLVASKDHGEHKTFANLLKAHKVECQSNTPLHTKVVRLVFATSRQRAYTYGRVLFAARNVPVAQTDLANWIRENGGVEEIKVKSSGQQSPSEKAEADATYAREQLANAKAIAHVGKVIDALKPNAEHNAIYSLALVRCDNGQDAEIVWGTTNSAAINKVLSLAGKQLRSDTEKKTVTNAKRAAAKSTRTAISNAASAAKRKRQQDQPTEAAAA